ncbi:MAG: hypothetical protein M3011_05385 [Actinomycetota bacterium]|nr:hypothetical protein [Actinomycetota bacterium]
MSVTRRRPVLFATALAIMAASTLGGAASAGTASATTPFCGITWGSLPKAGGALHQAPLVTTRTGQHPCYDRLVFEFDGNADGYRTEYASEVYTEGQGLALSGQTAGGALIKVVLLEPTTDLSGQGTYANPVGGHVANVGGYQTLRDVVFGGSFEGYTTFAVGVRARLPFRVFVLSGPGSHTRIVLDVAHRW